MLELTPVGLTDLALSCGPPSRASGRAARWSPAQFSRSAKVLDATSVTPRRLGGGRGLQPRANLRRPGSFSVKLGRR
jgi:hypothetical protein